MFEQLADLIFPAPCLACGKPPKPICTDCEPAFSLNQSDKDLFYAAELTAEMHQIITAVKDKGRTALIKPLAKGLAPVLAVAIETTKPTLLVCPPSSRKNFRKRGLNPALRIFKQANSSKVPITDRFLYLKQQPKEQRQLTASERWENVRDIFGVRGKSERILLVDDVRTTGSTLLGATTAIEAAGFEVVGSCVLAQRISFSQHSLEKKA